MQPGPVVSLPAGRYNGSFILRRPAGTAPYPTGSPHDHYGGIRRFDRLEGLFKSVLQAFVQATARGVVDPDAGRGVSNAHQRGDYAALTDAVVSQLGGIGIGTEDEEDYFIFMNKTGEELLPFIDRKVEATGTVKNMYGDLVFTVNKYALLRDDTPEQSS